ncbi:unnamed protein product [Rotaria sp. Silwood2]|nr:unnamed protein product [Rotaria sp. Silwood2]CAF2678807.1 unnamed protein product [Rotaria sp. Silwood2]CAF2927317.1 unnamed protein product [Rotaria sp. Silwood2]CAF3091923.1 unnamed protein product [Rotaria sp. Silwood2]CAF3932009.1 unnamed protein product [Rotaria sp. Silwood2]
MYSKRQQLPTTISNWIDKDVKVRKFTPNLGLMSADTRQNVMLSRKFFSNMLNLSNERQRKITRCDFEKNKFLKNQRTKAETIMPGLLPYIEPLINDIPKETASKRISNKNEQFISSSFQSFTSYSNTKSELTFSREQSIKQNKMPQLNSTKFYNRQQKSSERTYHLAQPKNNHLNSTKQNHVRSNTLVPLTVHDIFGDLDDDDNDDQSYDSLLPEKPSSASKDRRFQRLIHLFSEVYECEPKKYRSVKSIIQSNSSLQNENKQKQPISDSIELENHQQIISDECYNKTDMYLIDVAV